jgi:hypothetical protein
MMKSKLILASILATFIVPIVIALYLVNSSLNLGASTHKGHLLSQTIFLNELSKNTKKAAKNKWLLIHYQPSACLNQCQQNLKQLEWMYDILGKNQHRTQLIYLSNAPTSLSSKWAHLPITAHTDQLLQAASTPLRIIADPLQRPTLTYPVTQSVKDMLIDLKKLLIFSRSQ